MPTALHTSAAKYWSKRWKPAIKLSENDCVAIVRQMNFHQKWFNSNYRQKCKTINSNPLLAQEHLCPHCHVFAYIRANTRRSTLKNLTFLSYEFGKGLDIFYPVKLSCFAKKTSQELRICRLQVTCKVKFKCQFCPILSCPP